MAIIKLLTYNEIVISNNTRNYLSYQLFGKYYHELADQNKLLVDKYINIHINPNHNCNGLQT